MLKSDVPDLTVADACVDALRSHYGPAPADVSLVRSPYRICPIGAHIDHQLGCVSGMPIDRAVSLAFAPGRGSTIRFRSLDFPGEVALSLDEVPPRIEGDWGNYPRGAVKAFQQSHPLRRGLDGVISGTMPIGGLSSSSAVGVACLMALMSVNGLSLNHDELIALDQYVENVYLGLNNGILDQSIILGGRKDSLLHVDCLTGGRRPLQPGQRMPPWEILIVHSGVTQALVGTGYNRRVAECEEAAKRLLDLAGDRRLDAPKLRHVPGPVFDTYGERLPEPLRRRAAHFFSENQRVEAGATAWLAGDIIRFGALMNDSGQSSIDNYECGSPPLIALYRILREARGVFGTRFSGAGFRGACLALIDPARREEIGDQIRRLYDERCPEYRERLSIHSCGTDDGARILA